MEGLVRHRHAKAAAPDMLLPVTNAPHLDSTIRGNERLHDMIPVEQDTPVLARYGWGACYATA